MPDREKVIKAIEICYTLGHNCTECPLFPEDNCNDKLMHDALALLKEHKAIVPKRIDGKQNHFIKCGNCNRDLMSGYHYCPHCGHAVKWN